MIIPVNELFLMITQQNEIVLDDQTSKRNSFEIKTKETLGSSQTFMVRTFRTLVSLYGKARYCINQDQQIYNKTYTYTASSSGV